MPRQPLYTHLTDECAREQILPLAAVLRSHQNEMHCAARLLRSQDPQAGQAQTLVLNPLQSFLKSMDDLDLTDVRAGCLAVADSNVSLQTPYEVSKEEEQAKLGPAAHDVLQYLRRLGCNNPGSTKQRYNHGLSIFKEQLRLATKLNPEQIKAVGESRL